MRISRSMNRSLTAEFARQAVRIGALGLAALPLAAQWGNGYTYKATYTINSGQITGTQSNFTVVVAGTVGDFKTTANGGRIQHTCTQGLYALTVPADLIFTSDSGGATVLGWQFDTYDATTGAYSAHVLMPSAAVGTVLYAWYGKSSVSTCQGGIASASWDANTKVAVILPNQTGSVGMGEYFGASLTNHGATATTGLNSGMASLASASSAWIDLGNVGDIAGPITVEYWGAHNGTY